MAPRLWHKTINTFLSLGFTQSEADPNLYIYMTKTMLISDAKNAIQSSTVHSFICQRHVDSLPPHRYRRRRQSQGEVHEAIQIASLDPAHQLFKIDIQQSTNAHCSTPLGPHTKLNKRAESALNDKSTVLDNKGIKLYQAIVGSFIPQAGHLTATRRVLRYLRATADYRLLTARAPMVI